MQGHDVSTGISGDIDLFNSVNTLTRTAAGTSVTHQVNVVDTEKMAVDEPPPAKTEVSKENVILSIGPAEDRNVQELPPVDRGWRAWTFCTAAFVLEILTWGFSYGYGVFQNYYISHPPFQDSSPVGLAAVGTITLAIEFGGGIMLSFFHSRYPDYLMKTMWFGLFLTFLCLLLSSFVSKVYWLILLQGLGVGIGTSLLYWPIISLLSDWFVERRGLAGGIIFAGAGAGGFVFPLVANALLERVGFRWTMRTLAALVLVFGGTSLLFVRPRVPLPKFPKGQRRPPFIPPKVSFVGRPVFWAYSVTNLLQAMSYFPVSLYIAVFTSSISSPLSATIVLSLFNIAGVIGQVMVGWLSDRFPYPWIMVAIGVISSLSSFLLWGFAETLAEVFIFSILFGILGGGFPSVAFRVAVDSAGPTNPEQSPMALAGFTFVKGVAAIIGPIVSGILLQAGNSKTFGVTGSASYGKFGFGPVEIFVGSCAAATSISSLVVAATRPRV
ncbi:major facilitator superfamily domain-containing protein [Abortiporus biennis]|nr:major facilitator superfamily domain-containing protein [Abortiporus biennis]